MINKLKQFLKPKYETFNVLEIKRQFILDNYQYLKEMQLAADIFPVLKSNAYGHGLKEMCLILNDSKAEMVVVDSFPEAQIAYRYFKKNILILGEMPLKAYSYCDLSRTEFCVYNSNSLEALAKLGRAKIHLFVNSGMNREGIQNLSSFLENNKSILASLEVVGVCSHLAASEEAGDSNDKQLNKFLSDVDILQNAGFNPRWVHLGNSAAIFSLSSDRLTAFRSGLSLYGYNPFSEENDNFIKAEKLKPALRLSSTVVSLQNLNVGDKVSYNGIYQATKPSKSALIPFGYYEGLPRDLSNLAKLSWQGRYLQIAGRICMNLTCLAIDDLPVKLGDKIEIISWNKEAANSLPKLAKLSNKIIYEILVGLQSNIRRTIL